MAEQLLDRTSAAEAAWKRIEESLNLFTPEGQLQERERAESQVAEALPQLSGAEWAKTVRLLKRPEPFAFLDRARELLAALELPEETLSILLESEGLRRRTQLLQGEDAAAGVARGLAIVRAVQLHKSNPCWQEHAEWVRGALRRAWRASSLIEGINSVARMQQARHCRMSQGLLNLKRLYWNLRRFRVGRRRGKTPYEILGLPMPEGGWWQLLKLTPAQLLQHLSAQEDTSSIVVMAEVVGRKWVAAEDGAATCWRSQAKAVRLRGGWSDASRPGGVPRCGGHGRR
jgi:alkylhydroperoxidase family enzyme